MGASPDAALAVLIDDDDDLGTVGIDSTDETIARAAWSVAELLIECARLGIKLG
jgi:hypothetical protein